MKINKLKIENIIRDTDNLFLREGYNEDAIEEYKEKYRAGMTKPVLVQKSGRKLIDGFHRVRAKEELHEEDPKKFDEYIDVEYEDISDDELRTRATEINLKHGVRLRSFEKDKIIGKLLTEDHKTQEEVAKIFSVNRTAIEMRIKRSPYLSGVIQESLTMTQCVKNETLLKEYINGEKTQAEIAKDFNISEGRVSQIINDFKNSTLEKWQTGCTLEDIQKFAEIEGLTEEHVIGILKEKLKNDIDKKLVGIPKIICGDAFEELKQFPDKSIDLVIIDPPYNISSPEKITKLKGQIVGLDLADWDKQTEEEFEKFTDRFLMEIKRVLKDTGSFYIFIDRAYISNLWKKTKKVGMSSRNIIVWRKANPVPQPRLNHWLSATEYILFGTKTGKYTFNFGKGQYTNQVDVHNIIETPLCSGNERTEHPTQKPIALLKPLIELSSNEKEIVLDFFAGVGSTGVMAKKLRRNYFLIEKEQKWVDLCNGRLRLDTDM